MANWTESQRVRLAYEERILTQEFPHFQFYDRSSGGFTTIWGNHVTAASREYTICVWIKAGFPYEIPGLYVTSPCPLIGYGGKSIQSYGSSHAMHVWAPDWNGYVKVCHSKSEYWSASYTLVSVVMKGLLWLEAFEAHCKTGKSIDAYSLTFR